MYCVIEQYQLKFQIEQIVGFLSIFPGFTVLLFV